MNDGLAVARYHARQSLRIRLFCESDEIIAILISSGASGNLRPHSYRVALPL